VGCGRSEQSLELSTLERVCESLVTVFSENCGLFAGGANNRESKRESYSHAAGITHFNRHIRGKVIGGESATDDFMLGTAEFDRQFRGPIF
jgi:hypothetical protein